MRWKRPIHRLRISLALFEDRENTRGQFIEARIIVISLSSIALNAYFITAYVWACIVFFYHLSCINHGYIKKFPNECNCIDRHVNGQSLLAVKSFLVGRCVIITLCVSYIVYIYMVECRQSCLYVIYHLFNNGNNTWNFSSENLTSSLSIPFGPVCRV